MNAEKTLGTRLKIIRGHGYPCQTAVGEKGDFAHLTDEMERFLFPFKRTDYSFLPFDIKSEDTFGGFKGKLKTQLFRKPFSLNSE